MNRVVLGVLLVVAVGFAGFRVWLALRSDEDRILALVERQLAEFHSADMDWVDGFDPEFECRRPRLQYGDLRAIAGFLLLREVDRKTGRLRWVVDIPADRFEFTHVDSAAGTASARFDLELSRRGADETQWELRVTAELVRVEGAWRWKAADTETIRGRRPAF